MDLILLDFGENKQNEAITVFSIVHTVAADILV